MGIKKRLDVLYVERYGKEIYINTLDSAVNLTVKEAKKFRKELDESIKKAKESE